MMRIEKILPVLTWARTYNTNVFASDLVAALIVTVMLIPQSLAYAMLAGLPPQVGLYASILPLVAYAIFGTSRTLAVGPVAVISLMTAVAASRVATPGSEEYLFVALTLAILSGGFLLLFGLFRLGFLANFLSHPVVSGFITASGILIATSQLKHLLGVEAGGHTLPEIVHSLSINIDQVNLPTLAIGTVTLVFLFWVRAGLQPLLERIGLKRGLAVLLARTGPVLAVATSIATVAFLGLDAEGVQIVGAVPTGLPPLAVPSFDLSLWSTLLGSAALLSIIGFVESISVAQTLAARRRQRIDPNQELIGLGAANIASGLSGGYPVTGGFARSAVNFDAGAQTPAAGAFTAIGIMLATLFLTPFLFFLPHAVLAATIIVAVLSLVDIGALRRVWSFSKRDFSAMGATILITLSVGVELGILSGFLLSIMLHLYRSSRPHFAIVGQVPGSEHFRNIDRHDVVTSEKVLTVRIDESLYFANARFLEDLVSELIGDRPDLQHLVLMCSAVNEIDASGLESLEAINSHLDDAGIALHLSEIKGPVSDQLQRTDFFSHLTGRVFLHQYEAMTVLDRLCAEAAVNSTSRLPDVSDGSGI